MWSKAMAVIHTLGGILFASWSCFILERGNYVAFSLN